MSLETAQLRIAQIQSMMGLTQAQRYAAQTGGALAPDAANSPFAATLAQATGAPTATAAAFSPTGTGALSPMAGGAGAGGQIVAAAQGEVGQAEINGTNDSPRIAMYRQATPGGGVGPWCSYFASWACNQAGVPLGDQGQGFGRVDDVASWAQRPGRWMPPSATPQPGDLIVWDEHIGIVEGVQADGSIQTIEGNSSNQVARRTHPAGSMLGYVRPG